MFVQLASNYNVLPVSHFIFYSMQFYNFLSTKMWVLWTWLLSNYVPSSPVCPSICRSHPQFVPEISELPRRMLQQPVVATTGARCGVCLDFCFTLMLCFLFAPSFTAVEISSSVLESTAACVSLIEKSDTGQAYLVMIIIIVITTLNSSGRTNYC